MEKGDANALTVIYCVAERPAAQLLHEEAGPRPQRAAQQLHDVGMAQRPQDVHLLWGADSRRRTQGRRRPDEGVGWSEEAAAESAVSARGVLVGVVTEFSTRLGCAYDGVVLGLQLAPLRQLALVDMVNISAYLN